MKIIALILMLFAPSYALEANKVFSEPDTNPRVVKEWKLSLSKISKSPSTSYIIKKSGGKDKLHSNGHRDAIIWIPGSTDLSKDFIVVMWFHGHWGYVPHRTFEDRTLKQFVPMTDLKNFVVVIPEMPWSVHTPTPTKRNSLLWMKPGEFMKFVSQVENVLLSHDEGRLGDATRTKRSLGKIDYRIVGHSAGGSTIKRLGITGDLCLLNPSMVVWSDSSYGRWLDNSWDGCLKNNTSTIIKVFVRKWGRPWESGVRFMSRFQKAPQNIEFHVMVKPWTHKTIGNNVVKLSGVLE